MNTDKVTFGCINTQSGEFLEGRIKNGDQCFRRPHWWKRMFCKVWSDWETIGSADAQQRYRYNGMFRKDIQHVPFQSVVQKRTHIYKNEVQYRTSDIDGDWIIIDSYIFENEGKMIPAK